jgi:uncharacterized protein YwqG
LVPTLDPTTSGGSHIGGTPDVASPFAWPRSERGIPLAFLMQANFAEINTCDIERRLPSAGLLYVFFEWDDDVPVLEEQHRLLFDEQYSQLVSQEFPSDMNDEARFKKFSLKLHLEWTIPLPDEIGLGEFHQNDLDLLEFWDQAPEMLEDFQGLGPFWKSKHRFLGNPDFIQSPGLADGSLLFLQMDSDPPLGSDNDLRTGMMWGDGGTIYWISDEATLLKKDVFSYRPFWECS